MLKQHCTIQVSVRRALADVGAGGCPGQQTAVNLRCGGLLHTQAGLCLVGCLQLIAFTSLFFQFPYLYGRHGVQPVSFALDRVEKLQAAVTQAGGEML